MSRDIQDLAPCMQGVAIGFKAACLKVGIPIVIVQTYRTKEEQDALYAQGRRTPGKIVTHAKGGDSPHNVHLALDCAFLLPESGGVSWEPPYPHTWEEVGKIGEAQGLVWGGRFKAFPDLGHFEWPDWRDVAAGADPTGG